MLFLFFACFPKQELVLKPVPETTPWEAKSDLMGNISFAMNDCRQQIVNDHMYKQGLCKTTINQSETIKKTICSGTVSVRVVFKIDNNTVWCRSV